MDYKYEHEHNWRVVVSKAQGPPPKVTQDRTRRMNNETQKTPGGTFHGIMLNYRKIPRQNRKLNPGPLNQWATILPLSQVAGVYWTPGAYNLEKCRTVLDLE